MSLRRLREILIQHSTFTIQHSSSRGIMPTVEPRVSRGLRDLLPDQMLARQSMIDTIRGVYELYGFVPLATPAIEYLEVLSGSAGDEAQQSIFRVTNPENEALGLRFDLTVPLARVIAQYADLPRPFRRYQLSPVWRADKPDKVGIDKVRRELMEGYKDESGDTIRGLGLARGQVDRIEQFLEVKADARRDVIAQLRELFKGIGHAPPQIDIVERISRHLYALG